MERFVYRLVFGVKVGMMAEVPEVARATVNYLEQQGLHVARLQGLRLKGLSRIIDLATSDGAWHMLSHHAGVSEAARQEFRESWPYNGILIELITDYLPSKLEKLTDGEVGELAEILGVKSKTVKVVLRGHAIHAGRKMGRYGGKYSASTMEALREWWVAKMVRDIDSDEDSESVEEVEEKEELVEDMSNALLGKRLQDVIRAEVDVAIGIGEAEGLPALYEALAKALRP